MLTIIKSNSSENTLRLYNEDVVNFLSDRITVLKEENNPLATYIIPELVCNAVKSNYIIEKKLNSGIAGKKDNKFTMLEVVCLVNRKKPGHIDLIMRNYAQFYGAAEKRIEKALNSHWTKSIKLRKEKHNRENFDSSEYGLPSINNAIRKFYKGELFYDGYDDSYTDFGAYQFTMRLPNKKAGVR